MAEKLDGSRYRVKAEHPRRSGPLRVTDRDGNLIAESGQTCEAVSQEHLASMIRNGYVEEVAETPTSRRRKASESERD